MPEISLVIPTYQRESILRDTIRQLAQQPTLPNEIIIVDQGESKDFGSIVAPLAERGTKCNYIFSKYRAPGSSRNVGISIASSSIVLFIDDDVELETDIVGCHSKYYLEEPTLGGVAGHIHPKHSYSPEYVLWNTFTPKGKYVSIGRGGNMSFRLDVLRAIGGFNAFLRYTGEEGELCHRVIRAGYKIRNGENAAVKHLSAPMGGTRSWDDYHIAIEKIRDMIVSASVRRSQWTAWLWPLKNPKSIWTAIRSAPSIKSGLESVFKHYKLGLRYGMRARILKNYFPLSLSLAQGNGIDPRTGLPLLE